MKSSNIIKAFGGVGGAAAIQVLVSFIVFSVASYTLSKVDLGVYALALIFVQILSTASDFGLQTSAVRELSKYNNAHDEKFVRIILSTRLCSVIFTAIIVFLFQDFARVFLSGDIALNCVNYIIIFFITDTMWSIQGSVLQAKREFKLIALSGSLGQIIRLVVTVILLKMNSSVNMILMGHIIGNCVNILMQNKKAPIHRFCVPSLKTLKPILTYGRPLYVNSLIGLIYSRADSFLIALLLGPIQLAQYATAQRIPSLFLRFYESLKLVIFPILSSNAADNWCQEGIVVFYNSLRIIAFISSLFSLVFWVFGDFIITILFSAKYSDAVELARWFSLWTVITLLNYNYGVAYIAKGFAHVVLKLNIFQSIFNLLIYWFMIPRFGTIGAIFVLISVTAIVLSVYIASAARNHWFSLEQSANAMMPSVAPLLVSIFTLHFLSDKFRLIGFSTICIFTLLTNKLGSWTKNDLLTVMNSFKRVKQAKVEN